jgi:PAS domain S-box-containing protein
VTRESQVVPAAAEVAPALDALALLEHVPGVVFSFDADGIYNYANLAACEFLGRSRQELLGRSYLALFPEFRTPQHVRVFQRVMHQGEVETWNSYSVVADRWAQWRACPMPGGGFALYMQSLDEHFRAEMREHLQRVLGQAPLALVVFRGAEHIVEAASSCAHAFYGCESSGSPARAVLSTAALQRGVLERLHEVYATGRSQQIQTEHVAATRADGESENVILDTCYSALRLATGEVYGVLVTSVDVSAETRARKHAERERERLARVLEQAPFAVAVTSGPQHILKSANERQRRLFGARPTLNLSLREAFPEAELEPVHTIFDRAFRERETIVLREQHIGWDRDGLGNIEYGYFDLIYQPITDEHDCVEGLLCVSTEVSESVNARIAVMHARDDAERARDRLGQILSAIPTAITVTRGPEHIYDLVNPVYSALINGRDVLGHRLEEVFPQVKDNGFLEVFDRVYASGTTEQTSERQVFYDRNSNGTQAECFFSAFFAPLRDRAGRITGVVGAAIEVTEEVRQRKRNEALRAESEAARRALEQAHAELERRIAERTLDLFNSNQALAAEIAVRIEAEAARNELQRRFNSAREDEQRRTARDLHDQVGQTLSALMLAIKAATEAEQLPTTTLGRLEDALQLAEDLGRDIHEIAKRLRPAVLDAFGLYAGLRQLLSDWSQRSGTPVDFEAEWLKNKRYVADIETTLYRVTQEALTNIARHAQATRVSVVVERNAGQLICIVEDDGIGFSVGATDLGRMGLESMRERVTLVGGTLDLESTPGTGTTIIVSIPTSGTA